MTKSSPRRALFTPLLLLLLAGCSGDRRAPGHEDHSDHDHGHGHGSADSWSVTAWGRLYEIFPEIGALAVGEAADAHTHVTVLHGFAPLAEGRVEIVLTDDDGREEVFSSEEPDRPGVYHLEVTPQTPGERDLWFRIASPAGDETIRGGRVRVGTREDPGRITRAPAPRGARSAGEPTSFSKEQQWQSRFGTDWVRRGTFARALEGPAEARPAAGGEAWITAPVDGLVRAEPWPYVGRPFRVGEALFLLTPSVSTERSLAELQADADAARRELEAADKRLGRLEELIAVEATSLREVEEARARADVARARADAAADDLEAARAARQGRGGGEPLRIEAPFAGRPAAVTATPGAAVRAGERLARLVRTDLVWLSVALSPRASSLLEEGISGVVLAGAGSTDAHSLSFGSEASRLVSVAPSVDEVTGKVSALVEIPGTGVPLGSTWDAQILLPAEDEGVVIPTSALVDDGGETVVYLQLGGETFVREPVEVVARQGERALVEGLVPGQRLVTGAGESIRRSTLMSSGAGHGHVH